MIADWQHAGFGIYVHWPFCQAKCPYCDFNSHVSSEVDHDAWADALVAEINAHGALTPDRRVDTVFFGGGTPSLMQPKTVEAVINAIQKNWHLANNAEITLEANPTSVEADKFRAFSMAGVNRVSIGVQALNDEDLRKLGRVHNVAEALEAITTARDVFDRVSFDLIYARQDQTLDGWADELSRALSFAPDHLSMYQLTIEPGTVFGRRHDKGLIKGLPSGELSADMYEITQNLTADAGLPAYEISNHARKDHESQHNLIYWRYGDYLGIGPGAHGRITLDGQRIATESELQPEAWLRRAKSGRAAQFVETLAGKDQAIEYLMMSLRLDEGSDLTRFETLLGLRLNPQEIENQVKMGFIEQSGARIKTTKTGKMILNAILRELLDDL